MTAPPDASAAALVDAGCAPARAAELAAAFAAPADSDEARWDAVRAVLTPADPFAAHERLFAACYTGRSGSPAPAWRPTDAELAASHAGPEGFAALHAESVDAPESFWGRVLDELGVVFAQPPGRLLDADGGAEAARWLPGARFNVALSCFEGRDPDAVAVIHQRPGGPLQTITRAELRRQADAVAAGLRGLGLGPGDAVAVDMPMTAESVAIYFGIVLLGGAVVSIADSFAAEEIATRLRIADAKAIVTQDVILRGPKMIPLYARVVDADGPTAIVLPAGDALAVQLRDGDLAWADFLGEDAPVPHLAGPEHVTNVLFSSGTTGEPKAIPWTQVTPIKAAADGWAHHDIRSGDVVAWPTNLGWMMGPWLLYAALLNDATVALFEGAPHGADFCRFVQAAGVTMLGVVPSLVRAWQSSGATQGVDWSRVRCFSSTGEASNAREYLWLMSRVAGYRPVVEYCGGTEIGGGYICGAYAQPQAPSTFSTPAIGCRFHLLGEGGVPASEGEIALVPPMLGSSNRLLNRDHHAVYFDGMPAGPGGEVLRRHGDWMEALPGGYFRAHGRADDTMNLGGIKTSSAELERACNRVDGVVESAAVAVPPPGGGPSELHVFVVGRDDDALAADLQRAIRAHLNPLFKLTAAHPVDALPRTASGKVMRRLLRGRLAD